MTELLTGHWPFMLKVTHAAAEHKLDEYRIMYYNLVKKADKAEIRLNRYRDLCHRIWCNSESVRYLLMNEDIFVDGDVEGDSVGMVH
jgi:hypothetical protein